MGDQVIKAKPSISRWKRFQLRAQAKLEVAKCILKKQDLKPCPTCTWECHYANPLRFHTRGDSCDA